MIFPIIDCEGIVQIEDRFRILAEKTYKTPDLPAITLVEIEPEAGAGFFDVTGDLAKPYPERAWFLDYQYATSGTKTISVRVTTGTGMSATTATETKDIMALTELADNLFSSEDNIKELQEDVYKLLPPGKATFKYKARAAQNFILDWLWNNGYVKYVGTGPEPFTKLDVVDVEFISDWSTYVTLRMIFQSSSNQNSDVFQRRAAEFQALEERAREKFLLKLDVDGDGELAEFEGIQVTNRRLIRV